MARYRKVDVRMWGDERFRRLSPAKPSAQHLWLYLLTGPHTTNLPGLSSTSEADLADRLGWSLKGFREGFGELLREGLANADWTAHVLWIPKAIRYNPPDNPNVVKGWRVTWDEIPECPLKSEAYEVLRVFTEGLGEGFAKGFAEGLPKPYGEPRAGTGARTETGTGSVLGAPAAAPARRVLTLLPDPFPLTDKLRAFAEAGGLDAELEFAQWKDHHRAKGTRQLDWPASFRYWCRNAPKMFRSRRAQ